MGFPSPAADYIEQRLTVDSICGVTANSRVISTSEGYAVIDASFTPRQGNTVLIQSGDYMQFAKLHEHSLITSDGEAIDLHEQEGVQLLGVVTFFINQAQ
ncbi:hypothetical protein [Salmonella enterica]|uniref:hypothetical protein n=1 Tax=Salmonella enterica TaxID=28901 RepID=UPI001601C481|nr:hypothetical protein [Salmonella enterica]